MKPKIKPQRIVFLLTNDFRFDNRVRKLTQTSVKFGFESHVVSYVSPETEFQRTIIEKRAYVHRVGEVFQGLEKESLWKNILWFFPYIFLYGNPKNNKYLYEKTLELQPQIIWANDASTLLIGVKLKKMLNAKLIYDSHELWSEFPYVYHKNFRNLIFKIYALFYGWSIVIIERFFIKQADIVVTVNSTIAKILETQYRLKNKVRVITNAYPYQKDLHTDKRNFKIKYNIPQNSKILAYSGYMGIGRATQIILKILTFLPKKFCLFALIPSDQISKFKKQTQISGLVNRVFAQEYVKFENITSLLANCDLGLMLFENTSKNLTLALPNKFFEYLQARLPIISGPYTDVINEISRQNQIGVVAKTFEPEEIAKTVLKFLTNSGKYMEIKRNIHQVIKNKYSWQNESQNIISIFREIM